MPSLHQVIRSSGHQVIISRIARLLTLVAGVLLLVGGVRPWLFVPVGGLRLPLYPVFGWGALVGVAGLLLLIRPRTAPPLLLVIAAGTAYLANTLPRQWLARARVTTGTIDSWFEPLNQLLDKFRIAGLHLTDWSLPAERALGPGISLTYWGAGLAAAAALLTLLTDPHLHRPGACPACAARLSRRRLLRFCPVCGVSLTSQPICPECHATAEPGDRFCGQCGAEMPPEVR